ncbi:MAG: hypothetical protein D6722_29650, partial [Bacteroidetes bacterium]
AYTSDSSGYYEDIVGANLNYFETARVRRRIIASSLVVGWQGQLGDRWLLDIFAGAGARAIVAEYTEVVPGGPFANRPPPEENILNADLLNGPRYGMALRGGISIGYRLGG